MLMKAWKKRKVWRQRRYEQQERVLYGGMVTLSDLLALGRDTLIEWWRNIPELQRRMQDLPETNLEVGAAHFAKGNYADALLRYKFILKLEPNHVEAWYRQGRCQQAMGQTAEAVMSYRKVLQLKPDHSETRFMLAVLGEPGEAVTRTPYGLVREQFDLLAPVYDSIYVDTMQYQGAGEIGIALKQWFEVTYGANEPSASRFSILDAGCGTGQTGRKIRYIARRLVGVDISERMMQMQPRLKAEDKPLYDALVLREAVDYMASLEPRSLDVVTAGGVLNYNAALEGWFQAVAAVLAPKGAFAFTIEVLDETAVEPMQLVQGSGRFRHKPSYVKALAEAQGLRLFRQQEMMLYKDVPGMVCVFTRD